MGKGSREETADLIRKIQSSKAHYQWQRAVEQFIQLGWDLEDCLITVNPQLSFSAQPIHRIDFDSTQSKYIHIVINYPGLFGSEGVLPRYYLDAAVKSDDSGKSLRRFLSIISQRVFELDYLVWQCRQQSLAHGEQYYHHRHVLHTIAGVADESLPCLAPQTDASDNTVTENSLDQTVLLHYISHCALPNPSLESVNAVISDRLQIPLPYSEYQPGWQALDVEGSLGEQYYLADNSIVGDKLLISHWGVAIFLQQLTFWQFNSLLRQPALLQQLLALIQRFLGIAVQFKLIWQLIVDTVETPFGGRQLHLGNVRLGYDSPLGRLTDGVYRITSKGTA